MNEAAGAPVSSEASVTSQGLSSEEAQARLRQFGANVLPEQRPKPVLAFLRQLWGPVPWMLEASLLLELALGKTVEASILAILLTFNAGLGAIQEHRAHGALALLRKRLQVLARVLRDGHWRRRPAEELVPGDLIHLRMGDLVPADLTLLAGAILLDQSSLTGEAAPVEVSPNGTAYAGSLVRRGEATGIILTTGIRTFFGRTAELVRSSQSPSHLDLVILAIVKWLVSLDACLVGAVLIYARATHRSPADVFPFVLILLVASVPVALPATSSLAAALGSLELARQGVLVTHLPAVEEAAAMDLLCTDKTGTLTENQLRLAAVKTYPPYTELELIKLAALACDESTQDPFDLAVLAARPEARNEEAKRLSYLPFDPATKRSEALVQRGEAVLRIAKGAPHTIASLTGDNSGSAAEAERLALGGSRVLSVAAGPEDHLHVAGLLVFSDPLRSDAKALIERLRSLGVRIVMVTGDGLATAQSVAAEVGIGNRACPAEVLRQAAAPEVGSCDVFAGVYPEDKFELVRALQRSGHVVGMTGDGVNDAPALKQAEVGIAVASATDVAKAAASLVLTEPGLTGMLAAVTGGRRIYQRMLTYTLNKIVKTVHVGLFLSLGLLLTGAFVTTPRLVLLLLFANDFVTMSLASDNASFSSRPDRWHVGTLMLSATILALAWLGLSFAVFFAGRDYFHIALPQLQTLIFLLLVFTGQATVYLVRDRDLFFTMPGRWLLVSTVADLLVVSGLAIKGIFMTPIDASLVAAVFLAVVLVAFVLKLVRYRFVGQLELG